MEDAVSVWSDREVGGSLWRLPYSGKENVARSNSRIEADVLCSRKRQKLMLSEVMN